MDMHVISSTEARIIERICRDKDDDESVFALLTDIVRFDGKKKRLRFLFLKELWETGLVIKKYIEYPYWPSFCKDNVFGEISYYIKKGGYIVHHVNENIVSEDLVYITDVFLDSSRIKFCSKCLSGKLEEELVSCKEYCKRFLPSGPENQKVRIDVFRLVDSDDFLKKVYDEHIKLKKISNINQRVCLLNRQDSVHKSIQVLHEWFYILQDTVNAINMKKSIDATKIISNKDQLLFMNKQNKNSRKYLYCLTKSYNEIIKRIYEYIVGGKV